MTPKTHPFPVCPKRLIALKFPQKSAPAGVCLRPMIETWNSKPFVIGFFVGNNRVLVRICLLGVESMEKRMHPSRSGISTEDKAIVKIEKCLDWENTENNRNIGRPIKYKKSVVVEIFNNPLTFLGNFLIN